MLARPQTYEMLIVLLALSGIGIAGLLATRGKQRPSVSDYFLGGRKVGWLPLGISLAVTTIWGIWSLSIGMPSTFGLLGWAIPTLVAIAGLLLLGAVFAPRYRATEVKTVPTFLRDRYGKRVGFGVVLVSIFLTLFIRIPFIIFVSSHLLSGLWAWDPLSSALLMIVVPGVFAVAGGFRAVIATQGASGIAVAVGLLFLAFNPVSLSNTIMQRLLPGAESAWEVFLAGAVVVGFWYTCADQFVVQRTFAARSCAAVKGGTGLAALLVVLGITALATGLVGGPTSGNPHPSGNGIAVGFVGAAIIAFGTASLSGHFMTVATLFALDIVLVNWKKSDEAALVLVGRLTNTVVVFLAILTASSIALMGTGSLDWMAHSFSVAVPPIAAVTVIGVLWTRMHGRGAFWGLLLGWATGFIVMGLSMASQSGMMQAMVLSFFSSAFVSVAVSLISAPAGSLAASPGAMLGKGLEVREP